MLGGYHFSRPVPRLWRSLVCGVALGLALLLVGITPAGAQEQGAMAVDCEGATLELDADCQFGAGQEFTVAVQVVSPPEGGYAALQAKLRWDGAILDYRPSEEESQEAVWPECTIAARSDNRVSDPTDASLLFGCAPFPVASPPEVFTDTGTVLLFTFVCTGQGTSQVTLVPLEGDGQQGSHFLNGEGNAVPNSSLAAASVTCGGAAVTRPEAEVTPGVDTLSPEGDIASPEDLPPPEEQPTPAEGTATPGGPTATPGGPTPAPGATAALDGRVGEGAAQGDDDGDGIGAWVWVLVVLAAVAVAGAVVFWRMRARREGA